jgi:hypothetical protein
MMRFLAFALAACLATGIVAQAQTWTKLTNQPTFQTDTALLLTDGTVMVHQYNSPAWWRLTPDNTGSYLNGTWSALASMPSTYAPLYFASAVLPDGKVLVEGGEYNFLNPIETNLGAIYDPVANAWTSVTAPSGWSTIGDSPAVVLANGIFFMGRNTTTQSVVFNESTMTWTTAGTGKQDVYSEAGFAQLPDRTVLTLDTAKAPNAEKYFGGQQKWTGAGNTGVKLADPGSLEIGPILLRPDGTAFAMGASASGAGHTSTYTPPSNPRDPGTWNQGPDFPGGNDMADAPAALLPDGNVLCETSPGIFNNPVTFYEYDGTQFTQAPSTSSAKRTTSYEGRMLVLPSGQVLHVVADGSTIDAEIYTPNGSANPAWAPVITSVPGTLTRGTTVTVKGTQFNGLSAGAAYGDDVQMDTNYPIVRITNNATGHVFYAKTHDHSTMAVATGTQVVGTHVDIPSGAETGASTIEVVANGIASTGIGVTVQ